MSEQSAAMRRPATPGWLPKIALGLFILALASPLLVPFVLASDMPREVRAAIGGLLLFGAPMALMLAVVALMGQPAYLFLRRQVARQDTAPSAVGLARYRIGLVLLFIPVIVSWLEPFISPRVPAIEARRVLIGTLADGLVLIGLFVLGGEFWDKLHALFVHNARVLPEPPKPGATQAPPVQADWRFYLGAAVFIGALSSWLLVPAASAAGWSAQRIATLTGGIFIGTKVGMLAAIAIMGKAGFNQLKRLIGGVFKKLGPAQQVSLGRYVLGLILFLVPLLMTWLEPYAPGIARPGGVYGFLQGLSIEVLVLVGLFLLGGEFWDKVRALFKHRAKVEFPRKSYS